MAHIVEQLLQHDAVLGEVPQAQVVGSGGQQVGVAALLIRHEHDLGRGVGVLEAQPRVR